MKVAIITPFFASSVLEEKEIQKRCLSIRHPYPWITNLAEALAKRDVDIHVVTIGNEFNQDISFEKNNVIYDFLKSTGKLKRIFSLYESDKLRMHSFLEKKGFDIVHGQGLEEMFGYYAVTSKIPHVLTVHLYMTILDRIRDIDRIHFTKIFFLLLSVIQKKIALKRAIHIISISRVVRQILDPKGLRAKINDIENPVHPEFFLGDQSLSENYCLYVGSLAERKNVLGLLKAVEKTKSVRLKIISQTVSGTYYTKVKSYIENNLLHRVEFLGHKKNYEIVDYFNKAMFLVLPSMKEMAPMVISEAMAAGKPVIATAVDGVPYMILDGENGFLVPPGNRQKLAEKMELLFANRDLCKKMGKKARQVAESRWHPDVVAEQTMKAYRKIISNWQKGKRINAKR